MRSIVLARHTGFQEETTKRQNMALDVAMDPLGVPLEMFESFPASPDWYMGVDRIIESIEAIAFTKGGYQGEFIATSAWDIAPTLEDLVQRLTRLVIASARLTIVDEGLTPKTNLQPETLNLFLPFASAIKSGQLRQGHLEKRSPTGRTNRSRLDEKVETAIRDAIRAGEQSLRAIAQQHGVSHPTVIRIKKLLQESPTLPTQDRGSLICAEEIASELIGHGGKEEIETHLRN